MAEARSKSPFRETLEYAMGNTFRTKYLNIEERTPTNANAVAEELQGKVRDLENLKVQLESENNAFLT
jgi:hypothetical protein